MTCDAANFFLEADGKQKPSRNAYVSGPRKRTREGGDEKSMEKSEKANKSMIAVRSKFEMNDVQACRAFVCGRCLKTVLDNDPLTCTESHDKPKDQVLCCSMHKPGDPLYNKGFTKCRSLIGFPPGCGNKCEYNHGETEYASADAMS